MSEYLAVHVIRQPSTVHTSHFIRVNSVGAQHTPVHTPSLVQI